MKTQLIEIQCFGPISSFVAIDAVSNICIEQYESWQKMSFRNRWQVLGHLGVINLTVPVVGGREIKAPIREVKVDYSGRWQAEHWRTLESCYNRSPFFFHYAPSLRALLEQQPETLFDFASTSLQWVLKQLRWQGALSQTISFGKPPEPTSDTKDLRSVWVPRNRHLFSMPPYQQVFGQPFEANLSILDLLFNLGPQAPVYLSYLASA